MQILLGFLFAIIIAYAAFLARSLNRSGALAAVGYVAAAFYGVNAAASAFWGRALGALGRRRVFAVSGAVAAAWLAAMLALGAGLLAPARGSPAAWALVFGCAAAFAVADSVLESQLPALLQSPSFFARERDREAAAANLRMWMALGFSLQFGLGAALSPLQQAMVLAPLGVLGYGGLAACDAFVAKIDAAEKVKGSDEGLLDEA